MCQQCSYVMLEYSDSLGISHFNITLIIMSRPLIDLIKWCPLKNVNFNYEKLCDSIISMDGTFFLLFFMLFNVQLNISEVTQVQDQLLRVHASLSFKSWVPCLLHLSPRSAFFLSDVTIFDRVNFLKDGLFCTNESQFFDLTDVSSNDLSFNPLCFLMVNNGLSYYQRLHQFQYIDRCQTSHFSLTLITF